MGHRVGSLSLCPAVWASTGGPLAGGPPTGGVASAVWCACGSGTCRWHHQLGPPVLPPEPLWVLSPRGLAWAPSEQGGYSRGQASQEKAAEERGLLEAQCQRSWSSTCAVVTPGSPGGEGGRKTLCPPQRGASIPGCGRLWKVPLATL